MLILVRMPGGISVRIEHKPKKGVDFRNDPKLLNPALMASTGHRELYGTSKLMNVLHAQALAKKRKVQRHANLVVPKLGLTFFAEQTSGLFCAPRHY